MKNFYITGVSGVGKSSVAEKLKKKGIYTIDIDEVEGLCDWINNDTQKISYWYSGIDKEFFETHKYICDKEKLVTLINKGNNNIVVVVGLVDNQSEFLNLFDKIFLFHCDEKVFLKRIKERTNNNFGKHESDQEMILGWYKDFNKDMLNKGVISIDTDKSLEDVVKEVLSKF
ncbi:MAG: AAA family ATPase [Patescibacteria group bacterium]|mgnify:CR=1 FL=1